MSGLVSSMCAAGKAAGGPGVQSSSFKVKVKGSGGGVDVESQAALPGSQQHGMILPFVKLTVTFRDIRYYVPMPGEVHHFDCTPLHQGFEKL